MWHPLVGCCNTSRDLKIVPFSGSGLVHPAAWRKELTAYLLAGENTVPEFRLMRKLCGDLPAGAVVDVGANMGLYLLLLRSATQNPIVAFEPVPFLFDLFRRNLKHNQFREVEIHNAACGAAAGEVLLAAHMNAAIMAGETAVDARVAKRDFNEQATAARSGHQLASAPLVTLDEALGDRSVALIKIDCEGYELDVLRGARQVLARDRPRLFIEVHPAFIEQYGGSVPELLELLEPDYEMEFWDFNQARFHGRLIRSWRKHRPNPGLQLPDARAFLKACQAQPLPSQVYLVGRARARA